MATAKNNNDVIVNANLYRHLKNEKILSVEEERELAITIRESNQNICKFIAEAIFIVKFILNKYDDLNIDENENKNSVERLVIGFTETETPEEDKKGKNSSYSDETAELQVVAPQKFAELREIYNETVRAIRNNGKNDSETKKLQQQLRELIGTFIFTPALFNEIINHINQQFTRILEISRIFKEHLINNMNAGIRNFKTQSLHSSAKGTDSGDSTIYWLNSIDELSQRTRNKLDQSPEIKQLILSSINKINQLERFTHHDISEIITIYNNIKVEFNKGIQARNIMIRANIRLVMYEARKFNKDDETFNDLTQYGILGLIRAIEKFDYTMGFKLSTYATSWIKQYMNRALSSDFKSIRLPSNKEEKVKKLKKFSNDFYKKNGREPSNREIAAKFNMSVNSVIKLKLYSMPTVSLNESVHNEKGADDLFIENVYHVEDQESPQEALESEDLNARINDALQELAPQERDIIKRRFGIGRHDTQTLEEISHVYGVKAERIRQIEEQALFKLKTNSKFDFLKDLATDLP